MAQRDPGIACGCDFSPAIAGDGRLRRFCRVGGACSTASFGSCVQAHHGAICRFAMAHAPPAITASYGGERPEYGAGSWTYLPPLMMRPSK